MDRVRPEAGALNWTDLQGGMFMALAVDRPVRRAAHRGGDILKCCACATPYLTYWSPTCALSCLRRQIDMDEECVFVSSLLNHNFNEAQPDSIVDFHLTIASTNERFLETSSLAKLRVIIRYNLSPAVSTLDEKCPITSNDLNSPNCESSTIQPVALLVIRRPINRVNPSLPVSDYLITEKCPITSANRPQLAKESSYDTTSPCYTLTPEL
ncbi:hypothetical protein J6590_002021 [Homalodisca vitripennis]|nr:hypothetical protein J6590_002021 [Homalodisca vitripennis]